MINKNIISDAYPMHYIDDQLKSIIGSKIFTTLNLTKKYYQMKIYENSIKITAFSLLKSLF